jgi:hypothetical protein
VVKQVEKRKSAELLCSVGACPQLALGAGDSAEWIVDGAIHDRRGDVG